MAGRLIVVSQRMALFGAPLTLFSPRVLLIQRISPHISATVRDYAVEAFGHLEVPALYIYVPYAPAQLCLLFDNG